MRTYSVLIGFLSFSLFLAACEGAQGSESATEREKALSESSGESAVLESAFCKAPALEAFKRFFVQFLTTSLAEGVDNKDTLELLELERSAFNPGASSGVHQLENFDHFSSLSFAYDPATGMLQSPAYGNRVALDGTRFAAWPDFYSPLFEGNPRLEPSSKLLGIEATFTSPARIVMEMQNMGESAVGYASTSEFRDQVDSFIREELAPLNARFREGEPALDANTRLTTLTLAFELSGWERDYSEGPGSEAHLYPKGSERFGMYIAVARSGEESDPQRVGVTCQLGNSPDTLVWRGGNSLVASAK